MIVIDFHKKIKCGEGELSSLNVNNDNKKKRVLEISVEMCAYVQGGRNTKSI